MPAFLDGVYLRAWFLGYRRLYRRFLTAIEEKNDTVERRKKWITPTVKKEQANQANEKEFLVLVNQFE